MPRADAQAFQGLSAANFIQGASVEHVYTVAKPEGVQVSLLIFRHSPDGRQEQDFDGIWHRMIRERPKAALALQKRAGQRILVWTGVSPASAVVSGLAWRAAGGVTVLIQCSAPQEANVWLLADAALKACPSTLPENYQVRSAHDFVVQEVDKCVELTKQESFRQEACLRLSGLTFFLPEGATPETPDVSPLVIDQFPRWWEGARKSGQEQWLKERLARETARLLAVTRQEYPYPASRVALSLESLAGTRFPPTMIQGPEDLSVLKNHWERFTKAALSLPRPRWVSEEIDLWITWLESPAARAKRPTETSSSMLTLQRVLGSVGAPAELLEIPRINASRDTRQFLDDLDKHLSRLKAWWKEQRTSAVSAPSHVPPLFEEGGTPVVTRD